MFCRFCGGPILRDSQFCSHCGKRQGGGSPRVDALVKRFYLKTPYPYALAVFLVFLGWAFAPGSPSLDYETVSFEFELLGRSQVPESNLYRHHLSLIVENVGEGPVSQIPVQIRAEVQTDQPVQVQCDFLGRRLVILRDQEPVPLVVVLDDEIDEEQKRRYSIDGIVTSVPPFTVTYEIVAESSGEVLASFTDLVVGPGEPPETQSVADRSLSLPPWVQR